MNDEQTMRPLTDRAVRALVAINCAVLALLIGYVIVIFARAPDSFAVHFAIAGVPDQWVDSERETWFLLPICALVTGVGLIALALLEPRLRLHLIGLPQRARFEALPPARQRPLIREVMLFILTIALVDTLVLGAFEVTMVGLGQTPPETPTRWLTGAAIALYLLICVSWLLVLRQHLVRALAEPASN